MPGICDVIDPPLIQVEPKRQVACHLYPAPGGGVPGAAAVPAAAGGSAVGRAVASQAEPDSTDH